MLRSAYSVYQGVGAGVAAGGDVQRAVCLGDDALLGVVFVHPEGELELVLRGRR